MILLFFLFFGGSVFNIFMNGGISIVYKKFIIMFFIYLTVFSLSGCQALQYLPRSDGTVYTSQKDIMNYYESVYPNEEFKKLPNKMYVKYLGEEFYDFEFNYGKFFMFPVDSPTEVFLGLADGDGFVIDFRIDARWSQLLTEKYKGSIVNVVGDDSLVFVHSSIGDNDVGRIFNGRGDRSFMDSFAPDEFYRDNKIGGEIIIFIFSEQDISEESASMVLDMFERGSNTEVTLMHCQVESVKSKEMLECFTVYSASGIQYIYEDYIPGFISLSEYSVGEYIHPSLLDENGASLF